MATLTLAPATPVSSGEIRAIDPDRAHEVDCRHQQLAELLSETGHDAVLLTEPYNFAWLSAGGDATLRGGGESLASVFVTPEARVVLASNVDSGHLFDRELNGLGFQLKERPWHEPRNVLLGDLCRGRNVASDSGVCGTDTLTNQLKSLRSPLAEYDWDGLRTLGRLVTHAVEATARTFEQRFTEAEVAGQLAHRLMRHEVVPVRIQVMADGQGHRYRHWAFGLDPIHRTCILTAVGRKNGLHVGVTRTVSFGPPTREIQDTHQLATLVQTSGMYFSRPRWKLSDTWERVDRIYEKFGAPDEWRHAEQAEIIGYGPVEHPVFPGSMTRVSTGTPLFWHPTVRTAAVGDTILAQENGFELITPSEHWPLITVEVKGKPVQRPDILVREPSGDSGVF